MLFVCQKCTKRHFFRRNTSKIFWGGAKPPPETLPLQRLAMAPWLLSAPLEWLRRLRCHPPTTFFLIWPLVSRVSRVNGVRISVQLLFDCKCAVRCCVPEWCHELMSHDDKLHIVSATLPSGWSYCLFTYHMIWHFLIIWRCVWRGFNAWNKDW